MCGACCELDELHRKIFWLEMEVYECEMDGINPPVETVMMIDSLQMEYDVLYCDHARNPRACFYDPGRPGVEEENA